MFVLPVPNLSCNLLSIHKLYRGSKATFINSHCLFQAQTLARTISNARMINAVTTSTIIPSTKNKISYDVSRMSIKTA